VARRAPRSLGYELKRVIPFSSESAYSKAILKGAPDLLKDAAGLHLELSLAPLYEGQCINDEMIADLKAQGFEMWDLSPEHVDSNSARMLQGNATFFRN